MQPSPSSLRARLIDAAEWRFRRFGFGRTTSEDISAEAGTGKGGLYPHFVSKQEIYLAAGGALRARRLVRENRVGTPATGHQASPTAP
jgi:AcrR family transcriptional regulator